MRIPMRQEVSVCLRAPRGTIPRVPARCRAESGIRPMRRAGWAGHDRALTVAGPVTSITRGPWVTDTPPRRVLASEGVSLWGFHLRRAWGSSQEESPEGNPLTGESAAHRDSRAGATSAGWGSLACAKWIRQSETDGPNVRDCADEEGASEANRGRERRSAGVSGTGAPTQDEQASRREAVRPTPRSGSQFAEGPRARAADPRSAE